MGFLWNKNAPRGCTACSEENIAAQTASARQKCALILRDERRESVPVHTFVLNFSGKSAMLML